MLPDHVHHYWLYAPEAPEDVEAFQRDVLAFLDKDSEVRGVKHYEIIASASVGRKSWLQAGVGLSNDFIESLIIKMPNLKRLRLYSNSSMQEIDRAINATGRDFEEIQIFARNGKLRWKDDRPIEEPIDDEEFEDIEEVVDLEDGP
jgi:hypothetical protein